MKTRMLVSILILFLSALIYTDVPLYADKGSIPFKPYVQIFEPNQRALIAWNGWEEILVLTTDLHASESTKVLEVIPLPSEPEVKKGDIEVFQKATDLINEKLAVPSRLSTSRSKTKGIEKGEIEPAGEITFHEKIGAHDISVAHVLNNQSFIEWVDTYLKSAGVENPQIPEKLKSVIAEYLEEGFRWFVFDVVQLDRWPKTNEAIQYRFETPFLYYPLKITQTEEGYTTIDLLILTPETEDQYKFTGIPEERIVFPHEPISLTRDELLKLNVLGEDMEIYSSFKYLFFMEEIPYLRIWKIEDYLSSFNKDLIVKDSVGSTALMDASFMGNQKAVKALLEGGLTFKGFVGTTTLNTLSKGVDVNERDNYGGTALVYASWQGQTRVAELLIEAGADVNAQTNYGWTALMSASSRGHPEFAQLLIEAGADVTLKTNSGDTAMKLARESGHAEVLALLIETSGNTSEINNLLFRAVIRDDFDEVKWLIEAGADINALNKSGYTALMLASYLGRTEVAKLLVNAGADVRITNNDGYTALMLADQYGHKEVAELLREAGADEY